MKRTIHQRIAAALRRLSLAVDRSIVATTEVEKQKAKAWANAWAKAAKL
jgi:hypothetical protein